MSNSNYNDIFTTTLESRTGKLADNVSDSNALLSRLREKKNMENIQKLPFQKMALGPIMFQQVLLEVGLFWRCALKKIIEKHV
ncbi:MAG: hypothetical protein EOM53_00490 [Alphaproteobacteria bacterium]|nr:hypothetical protein [Alphaproteobacteria bacterium]